MSEIAGGVGGTEGFEIAAMAVLRDTGFLAQLTELFKKGKAEGVKGGDAISTSFFDAFETNTKRGQAGLNSLVKRVFADAIKAASAEVITQQKLASQKLLDQQKLSYKGQAAALAEASAQRRADIAVASRAEAETTKAGLAQQTAAVKAGLREQEITQKAALDVQQTNLEIYGRLIYSDEQQQQKRRTELAKSFLRGLTTTYDAGLRGISDLWRSHLSKQIQDNKAANDSILVDQRAYYAHYLELLKQFGVARHDAAVLNQEQIAAAERVGFDTQLSVFTKGAAKQLDVLVQAAAAQGRVVTESMVKAETTYASGYTEISSIVKEGSLRATQILEDGITAQDVAVQLGLDKQNAIYSEAAARRLEEMAADQRAQLKVIDEGQVAQASTSTESKIGSLFGGGGLAGLGLLAGGGLGLGYITSTLNNFQQIGNSIRVLFSGAADGVNKANDAIKQLQLISIHTPYQFKDLAAEAQQLVALKVVNPAAPNAVADLTDKIKTLFEQAARSNIPLSLLNRGIQAVARIGSTGTLQMQQLTQITRDLRLPLVDVAGAMGLTVDQLKELTKHGAIPAARGIQAVFDAMKAEPGASGIFQAQLHTIGGAFSNVKDNIQYLIVNALGPLGRAFVPVIAAFALLLQQINNFLSTSIGHAFIDFLTGVIAAGTALLVYKGVVEVFSELKLVFAAISADPTLLLTTRLLALAGILFALYQSVPLVRKVLDDLGQSLHAVLDLLSGYVTSFHQWADALVKGTENWSLVGYRAKEVVRGLGPIVAIQSSFGLAARTIRDDLNQIDIGLVQGFRADAVINGLSRLVSVGSEFGKVARDINNDLRDLELGFVQASRTTLGAGPVGIIDILSHFGELTKIGAVFGTVDRSVILGVSGISKHLLEAVEGKDSWSDALRRIQIDVRQQAHNIGLSFGALGPEVDKAFTTVKGVLGRNFTSTRLIVEAGIAALTGHPFAAGFDFTKLLLVGGPAQVGQKVIQIAGQLHGIITGVVGNAKGFLRGLTGGISVADVLGTSGSAGAAAKLGDSIRSMGPALLLALQDLWAVAKRAGLDFVNGLFNTSFDGSPNPSLLTKAGAWLRQFFTGLAGYAERDVLPALTGILGTVGGFLLAKGAPLLANGIYQLGKLIGETVSNGKFLTFIGDTLIAIGTALGAAVAQFVLGFGKALVNNRDQIASAILHVLEFAFQTAWQANPLIAIIGTGIAGILALVGVAKIAAPIIQLFRNLGAASSIYKHQVAGDTSAVTADYAALAEGAKRAQTQSGLGFGAGTVKAASTLGTLIHNVVGGFDTLALKADEIGTKTVPDAFIKMASKVEDFGTKIGNLNSPLRNLQGYIKSSADELLNVGGDIASVFVRGSSAAQSFSQFLHDKIADGTISAGNAVKGLGVVASSIFAAMQGQALATGISLQNVGFSIASIAAAGATGGLPGAVIATVSTGVGFLFGEVSKASAAAKAKAKADAADLAAYSKSVYSSFDKAFQDAFTNSLPNASSRLAGATAALQDLNKQGADTANTLQSFGVDAADFAAHVGLGADALKRYTTGLQNDELHKAMTGDVADLDAFGLTSESVFKQFGKSSAVIHLFSTDNGNSVKNLSQPVAHLFDQLRTGNITLEQFGSGLRANGVSAKDTKAVLDAYNSTTVDLLKNSKQFKDLTGISDSTLKALRDATIQADDARKLLLAGGSFTDLMVDGFNRVKDSTQKATDALLSYFSALHPQSGTFNDVVVSLSDLNDQFSQFDSSTVVGQAHIDQLTRQSLPQLEQSLSSQAAAFAKGDPTKYVAKLEEFKAQLLAIPGLSDNAKTFIGTLFGDLETQTNIDYAVKLSTDAAQQKLSDLALNLQNFAKSDPTVTAFMNVNDPTTKLSALGTLISDYVKRDPNATAYMNTLDPQQKLDFINQLAQAYIASNPKTFAGLDLSQFTPAYDGVTGAISFLKTQSVDIPVAVTVSVQGVAADASAAGKSVTDAINKAFGVHVNALGGIISAPQVSLVGEAGAELILPLTNQPRMSQLLAQLGFDAKTAEALSHQFAGHAHSAGTAAHQLAGAVGQANAAASAAVGGPQLSLGAQANAPGIQGAVKDVATGLAPLGDRIQAATKPGFDSWLASVDKTTTDAEQSFKDLATQMTLSANQGAQGVVNGFDQVLTAGTGEVRSIMSTYLGALVGSINPVLAAIGQPELKLAFAEGGQVPGVDHGYDSVPAMVRPGEFVVQKSMVDKYGVGRMHAINQGVLPHFATGGLVGNYGGASSALQRAVGDPYVWGGVGPSGYDCSGLWSMAFNAARGIADIFQREFTTLAFMGSGSQAQQLGFQRGPGTFMVGATADHMGGTLGGVNFEATPPRVRTGSSAWGADNPYFGNNIWHLGPGSLPVSSPLVVPLVPAFGNGALGTVASGLADYTRTRAQGFADANTFLSGTVAANPGETGGASNLAGIVGDLGAVTGWISAGMNLAGVSDPAWFSVLEKIGFRESRYNPSVVNNWDSNAKAGHPSKGWLQMIDSSFLSYAVPGHLDIFNPVDEAAAAIRYILGRYGSPEGTPANYYENGGLNLFNAVARLHPNELVLPLSKPDRTNDLMSKHGLGATNISVAVTVPPGSPAETEAAAKRGAKAGVDQALALRGLRGTARMA